MASEVLFSSVEFDRYNPDCTLPAKFGRLLDATNLSDIVKGKHTAVKMHVGRRIGYTTVHPLFIKILVDKLVSYGARAFITDQSVSGVEARGYTESYLGVPIVDVCGVMGKYFYPREVDFRSFKNVDVGGHIHDADVMIDLSHAKGHGACGFGGACKNIAMGCVTDRTRSQIHSLEGGLDWEEEKCIHCGECITGCNHNANRFDKNDKYRVMYHHCTFCQHCVKVCPTGAISMEENRYQDFQTGMAICTEEVLKTFDPGNVYYLTFLTNITALCDCWGLSTPSLVPDIGVMGSSDIVAIERAAIDSIKFENLLPNSWPKGQELGDHGHLFERLHGKSPYVQLDELEKRGLGSQEYKLVDVE